MKNPVPRLRLIGLLVPIVGLLLCADSVAARDYKILDRPVESFETGVPVPRLAAALWLDDHRLLIDALPEGAADLTWVGGDTLTRVVLVDFEKKRVEMIAENAAILRFDRETLDAVIGPMDHRKADAREIHVAAGGEVMEVRRFAAGEPLPWKRPDWPRDQLFKPLRTKADGYLLGDKTKLDERVRLGTPVPTTWVRPGQPDLPLPIDFVEISRVVYLDFLKKYLLNTSDSQASSNTNSHKNRVWKHPYTFTPYRLLSLDGTIEEIPYPQFVFDYGIDRFDEFSLTRAGILVSQVTQSGGSIYLFQSNQLYRLTSKATGEGARLSLPMSGVNGLSVAPNGCYVAYFHYDVGPIGVEVESPGPAPRYLAILNSCSGPTQRVSPRIGGG